MSGPCLTNALRQAHRLPPRHRRPLPRPGLTEARDPRTGELESGVRMGEDSADDEAFTCLDPFEHDWDDMNLGLDDPR